MSDLKNLKFWLESKSRKKVNSIKDTKILSLSNCGLDELHPDFHLLSELRELRMSNNLITKIDLSFQKLNLFQCRHSLLKNVSIDCPNLKELDLGINQIEDITLNCPKLEKLFIPENNLKSLDLRKCPNLKKLAISYNKLNYLHLNTNNKIICFISLGNNFIINEDDIILLNFFKRFKFHDYTVLEKTSLSNLL